MLEIDLENVINARDEINNFHAQLIRLMFKADMDNFARLATAFPNTALVVKRYKETGQILRGIPYE